MEPTLLRLPRLSHARSFIAVVFAVILPLAAVGLALLSPAGARHGLAAGNPPPPPTFVPTVIPPPPPPPTPTSAPPTATPLASPTATATVNPTTVPSAAPTATAIPSLYSLDAARVSKLHDPGDLAGLTAVRPGSHVWLMIYYTFHSLPHAVSRVATYDILGGTRLLYRIAYRATEKAGTSGRFVKYTVYHLASTLPFGDYRFRATLAVGGRTQVKTWKFRLAAHDHVVYHTGS